MKYRIWAHKEKLIRGYFEVEANSKKEAEEKAIKADIKDLTPVEERDWEVSYGKTEEVDE